MNVLFDFFGNPEKPALSLCNLDDTLISPIIDPEGLGFSFEFLNPHEMSFRVYEYYQQDGEKKKWAFYDQLTPYKQVFAETIGYFVVTDCSETREAENPYKDVTATSCEITLGYKNVTIEEGARLFANPDNWNDPETIVGKIAALIPKWKIIYIDEGLEAVTRFLDAAEGNLYDFIKNTVEDRYGCIFQFDALNHTIRILDQNRTLNQVDIFLSHDNFINNISIDRTNDQIYTALRPTGGDGISIESVNPIGGSLVYQFDYFQNDMPDGLWDAVVAWKQKINENQEAFSQAVLRVQELNGEIITLEQKKLALESQRDTYQEIIDLRKESNLDYTDIQVSLNDVLEQIAELEKEIAVRQTEKVPFQEQFESIQSDLSFANNFTPEQILQLDPFIIYGEFRDDNIITTSNMSYEDKQKQSQELYGRCVKALDDTLVNKGSFKVDSQNFLFDEKFRPYAEKLELGAKIYVEENTGDYTPYLFVGCEYSYDDDKLSLSFNNLGANPNDLDTYAKLYGELNKATNLIQNSLSSKANTTTFDELYAELQDIKAQAEAILSAGELTVKKVETEYISVQNAQTPGRTIIDGGNIVTGTINAELVKIINLIADHLVSINGDFKLNAWAAVLSFLYKSMPRINIYSVDPSTDANAPGIVQLFSGSVSSSGTLLDDNARYTYVTPNSLGIGTTKNGGFAFKVDSNGDASLPGKIYGKDKVWIEQSTGMWSFMANSPSFTDGVQVRQEQSGEERMILRGANNGTAYLGSATMRWNTGFFTNNITQSDLKDKENISPIENAHAFVMGLQPISYILKDGEGKRTHMGFGAQDVAKLAQECRMGNLALYQAVVVDENGDESYYHEGVPDEQTAWGLNYHEFLAPIVATIQEQQRQIDALKQEIETLKGGSI